MYSFISKILYGIICHQKTEYETLFFLTYALFRILSNDDGDGNENGKKAFGLDWQNNNFERASLNFVHFFAII